MYRHKLKAKQPKSIRFTAEHLLSDVADGWAVLDNSARRYIETSLTEDTARAFAAARNLDPYEIFDAKKFNP